MTKSSGPIMPAALTESFDQTLFDKRAHYARIGQRRNVAQLIRLVLGNLAQDAAHDLARACLRQRIGPLDVIGQRDRPDLLAHFVAEFLLQSVRRLRARDQGDKGIDALPLDFVRAADYRGLGHLRMRNERALHFRGAYAMAGNIDDVVHAAGDPPVAVGVAARAVSGAVHARIHLEVRINEALVIAVHRAHLPRPGIGDDQIAGTFALDALAI